MNTQSTGNREENAPRTSPATPYLPIGGVPVVAPGRTTASPETGEVAPGDRVLVDTTDAEALLADKARRKQIEDDLRRMGMSPAEVQLLLNADARSFDPTAAEMGQPARSAPIPPSSVPQPASAPSNVKAAANANAKSSMHSMQAFAAELMAQKAAAQTQAVRQVSLDLSPFRESSRDEIREAETLLRDAAMYRRKENFREAEAKVRAALQLVPKDAAALELFGDILQGVARTNEALAAYQRAKEADPKRSSAERKYGELLVLQQQWDMTDTEATRTSSRLGIILSLLFPGLGQFNNRDYIKGTVFLALDALCIYLLAFSPWGFGTKQHHGLSIGLIAPVVLTVVAYITALIDTISSQQSGTKGRGWNI